MRRVLEAIVCVDIELKVTACSWEIVLARAADLASSPRFVLSSCLQLEIAEHIGALVLHYKPPHASFSLAYNTTCRYLATKFAQLRGIYPMKTRETT